MKTFLIGLFLLAAPTGCTTHNQYGKCIGALDKEDTAKAYEIEYKNLVIAVIFSETALIPLITIAWDYKCPTK